MPTRCGTLATLLALALSATAARGEDEAGPAEPTRPVDDRPNLVLIVSDDHGWDDHGFMGSPHVKTPHLDALAAAGTVYEAGFNPSSLCRPSLRSLLTGLYEPQWTERIEQLRTLGVRRMTDQQMRDFRTLPELLGERGYASFQAGKSDTQGFELVGFTEGQRPVSDPEPRFGSGKWIGRDSIQPVLDFVDAHRHEPFFVWLAPMLPHFPHDPPRSLQARYPDPALSRTARLYYANITRLDERVGELMAHLRERGLAERTLVVYLTDNGWDQAPDVERQRLIDGDRGKKTLYEKGLRTPVVLHWPGHVPAARHPDALVASVDLFPTLLDYAGASAPPDREGRSLRPHLEGRAAWERDAVFATLRHLRRDRRSEAADPERRNWTVRTAEWQYLRLSDAGRRELYRVGTDPGQRHDLSARHPETVRALDRRIERFVTRLHALTEARRPAWLAEIRHPRQFEAPGTQRRP